MFDLKSAFGFDKDSAIQGVKHVFGPNKDTDWVTICKLPNENYDEVAHETFRNNHEKLSMLRSQGEAGKKAAIALDNELHNLILAKTIVTNWGEGIADGDEPIPYTVETCAAMLEAYPEFKDACIAFAKNRFNFPMVEDVETVKK